MLPWFPVVGLALGGMWALWDALLGPGVTPVLRGALDALVLVLLTGGLHLDGLADAADGLFSHRGREEALRIMRDSRIGTWGVLALIFVLGLKVTALSSPLSSPRWVGLVLVPAYGRLAMVAGILSLPYGRGEDGLAHSFFSRMRPWTCLPGAAVVLGGSLLLEWAEATVVNTAFVVGLIFLLRMYGKRMGCITGDMLGALGETMETLLLVSLALIGGR